MIYNAVVRSICGFLFLHDVAKYTYQGPTFWHETKNQPIDILKFFISRSHFAKDPVSVWAFDYKQLVFETGFKNRI